MLPRVSTVLLALLVCAGCRVRAPAAAPLPRAAAGQAAYAAAWTTPPEAASSQAVPTRAAVRAAVPTPWTLQGNVALLSAYVWRGALLVDDPVLQPTATLGYGGWSFNVWGNIDLGDANGRAGEVNEVDLTLSYSHTIKDGRVPATLFGGGIWYTSPTGWFTDLAEIYAGVGFDVFLQPTVTVYVGVVQVEGLYAQLALSHQVALGPGSLTLSGGLGAGEEHHFGALLGAPTNALGEVYLGASWGLPLGRWTIAPSVRFSSLIDGDLRDASAKNDHVVFGLTVSVMP